MQSPDYEPKHESGRESPREPDGWSQNMHAEAFAAPAHGRHAERPPEPDQSVHGFYKNLAGHIGNLEKTLHEDDPESPEQQPEIAELAAAIRKQGESSGSDKFLLRRGTDQEEMRARGQITDALRKTAVFVAPISWVNRLSEVSIFDTDDPDSAYAKVVTEQLQEVLGAVRGEPETSRTATNEDGSRELLTPAASRFAGVQIETVRTFANPRDEHGRDRLDIRLARAPEPESDHVHN